MPNVVVVISDADCCSADVYLQKICAPLGSVVVISVECAKGLYIM